MNMTAPIRLLVADDHALVGEGLVALLEKQADFQVVGMAQNGKNTIDQFRQHQPNILLLDLCLPDMGGADVVTAIRAEYPQARIIIFTTYDGDEDIYQALKAGARGYLLKNVPCQEMFAAIRLVHSGHRYITPQMAEKLAEHFSDCQLTKRELEVLHLLVQGKSNRTISQTLCVVEGTIKFHVRNILEKLGASDRTQAVTIALKRGLARL